MLRRRSPVALAACVTAARASRRKERKSFIFNNNKRLLARAKGDGEDDSYSLVVMWQLPNLKGSTAGEGGRSEVVAIATSWPSHHPESGWTAWNSSYSNSSGYVAHLPRLVVPPGPLPGPAWLLTPASTGVLGASICRRRPVSRARDLHNLDWPMAPRLTGLTSL